MTDTQIDEKKPDATEELVDIEVEAEDETPAQAAAEGEAPEASADAGGADADEDDGDDEDDDDEDDERLSADQREEQASKKLTRSQRAKERRRLAIERERQEKLTLRAEMERLRIENAKRDLQFIGYRAQQDSAAIDAQAATLQQQHQHWQRVKADAISKNNGQAATRADYELQQVQQKYAELGQAKTRVNEQLQGISQKLREVEGYEAQVVETLRDGGPVQQEAPRINADGQRMAADFMASIPWYKQGTKAGDSAIVDTIDVVLMRDGFDPNTREYWTEFRTRLKAALPKRFENPKNASPPVGSSRQTLSANKIKMRIPAAAMETMKLAGIISDDNKVQDRAKFNAYVARLKSNEQAAKRA